jgi:hypothetical protein
MGHHLCPVALSPVMSHLSHGHVAMDHGTFYNLNPYPMGILQWTMDTLIIQPLSHGPQCMPHGPVCHLSHGHIAMDHGTCQLFNLCPMGYYQSPMVLFPAVSHLSHGHVAMDHGMFCHFHLYPVGHCTTSTSVPWDFLTLPTLSYGLLFIPHGPVFCYAPSVPWTNLIGPWVLSTVQPLSHGPLCIPHGPASRCVTSVPWTCCNIPWDILQLQDLSHGHVAFDLGDHVTH